MGYQTNTVIELVLNQNGISKDLESDSWLAQHRPLAGKCWICSLFSSATLREAVTVQLLLETKWFTMVPLQTAVYKSRGVALEHYNFWLNWLSLFLCWLDYLLPCQSVTAVCLQPQSIIGGMIKHMHSHLLKGYLSFPFKIQIFARVLFIFQWFLLPSLW